MVEYVILVVWPASLGGGVRGCLDRSCKQDVVLTDEVRVGLTSSFLPGVSLLFGALFSYTISLLVRRTKRKKENSAKG